MGGRPNIILVHGAFHGGWCWRRVIDRLHDRGARVFAPSLTGLGDRVHLLDPSINLSVHVTDIVNLIEAEDLRGAILCGHSYGGMVISGVAEALPGRLSALVYLDALVPRPAACLWDYLPPAGKEDFERATINGLVAPKSAEAFMVNRADCAWVNARSSPQPRATFHERLPTTHHRAAIPSTYVFASCYDSPMLRAFAEAATGDPAWRRVDVPCGHDVMVDAPDAVADILMEAAAAI